MGVHNFPKGICSKVNKIVKPEFELANYDSRVKRFKQYANAGFNTILHPVLMFKFWSSGN